MNSFLYSVIHHLFANIRYSRVRISGRHRSRWCKIELQNMIQINTKIAILAPFFGKKLVNPNTTNTKRKFDQFSKVKYWEQKSHYNSTSLSQNNSILKEELLLILKKIIMQNCLNYMINLTYFSMVKWCHMDWTQGHTDGYIGVFV